MKALGIIGIILSSLMIISSLAVIGEPGVWIVLLTECYFLAQSIVLTKNGE